MSISATPNYFVYPTSINLNDNVWKSPSNDPYHGKRVRHDEILHKTLTKIFQKRCGGKGSEIRKLFHKHNSEREAIFKLILEQKPILSKILQQNVELPLLWITVLSCYQKSAELLVRSGADVNERCRPKLDIFVDEKTTILHILLQMFPSPWNEKFIDLVIHKGAYLQTRDPKGQTALYLAVIHGRVEVTKMLLEKGAKVNATDNYGKTPLLAAIYTSKAKELVPLLVEHGADVAAKWGYNRTNVLHCLVEASDVENVNVARLLIEKGASLDDREQQYQYQPIHLAALRGKNELVKLFLDHGADVNSRARRGVTPLHLAAKCKNPMVLITLIKRGTNIDNRNYDGRTALHEALCAACFSWDQNNLGENIRILISAGADICVDDNDGNTPFSVLHQIIATDVDFNVDLNYRDLDNIFGVPEIFNYDTRNQSNGCKILKILALKKSELYPSIELKDERRIKKSPKYWKYYQDYLEQINKTKSTRFFESCTLFDLLTKCYCQIAAFVPNPEFEMKFKLCDLNFHNICPSYTQEIREAFKRAERHHLSIVKQEDVINEAVYNSLPYVVVRKVIGNLILCEECAMKKNGASHSDQSS